MELGLKNYNIFRRDRNSYISICSKGGGVLIGIHFDILAHQISDVNVSIEHLFLSFIFNGSKFIFGGVYLPSNSPSLSYELFMNTIIDLISSHVGHTFIFCGYFNLPRTSCSNDYSGLIYSTSDGPPNPLCARDFCN